MISTSSICAAGVYLGVAVLCYWARGTTAREARSLWFVIGGILLVLATDRLVGIHSFLANAARHAAKEHGLYDGRRSIQKLLLGLVAIAGVSGGCLIVYLFRGRSRRQTVAAAGMMGVLCFALVRVISLHVIEVLLETPVLGMPAVLWIEYVLLIPIAVAAILEWRARGVR